MLTVGNVKGWTSEVKSLLEIGFGTSYSKLGSHSAGQFSEVNLYWFSLPKVQSSEVILTDPNGVVVFTSDKTGENSEVFIPDVIGTYTATITATSIPGGDAKTKEELLCVHEGKIPYVGTWTEADGTRRNSTLDRIFTPYENTGLNVDTKFSWALSSASGPMSFLIEISDPDGKIVHSVSGDAVLEEIGSHRHTTDILGEYTITATATNIVGTATYTDTILCKSWPPLITDKVLFEIAMPEPDWWWEPAPDPVQIQADRKASKWGWWFEREDHYNYSSSGIGTYKKPEPYRVQFAYNTGNAQEAKFEWIDPDGIVVVTEMLGVAKSPLSLYEIITTTVDPNIGYIVPSDVRNPFTRDIYDAWPIDYWPSKRGMYTGRLTLKYDGPDDPAIFEHHIPFYENLADKENNPDFQKSLDNALYFCYIIRVEGESLALI